MSSGEAAEGYAGVRLERRFEGGDDLGIPARGRLHILADRAAVGGQRVLMQQALLDERAQHHRQTARVIEILHQESPRRHQVDQAMHTATQAVEVIQREIDPHPPRDRQQMHHGVG
jgi:hypothetical protein